MAGWVSELVRRPRLMLYGRCSYCGTWSFGRVCRAHRDLAAIEQEMTEPTAPSREVSAAGSDTTGG